MIEGLPHDVSVALADLETAQVHLANARHAGCLRASAGFEFTAAFKEECIKEIVAGWCLTLQDEFALTIKAIAADDDRAFIPALQLAGEQWESVRADLGATGDYRALLQRIMEITSTISKTYDKWKRLKPAS